MEYYFRRGTKVTVEESKGTYSSVMVGLRKADRFETSSFYPTSQPDPSLTVYVSTATSSLTLTRKLSEVVEFEARVSPDDSSEVLFENRSVLFSLPRSSYKHNSLITSLLELSLLLFP